MNTPSLPIGRRDILASSLALATLAGCGRRARLPGEVVIGSSPTGVPFSFVDPYTNLLTGSMVDTAKAIMAAQHLTPELRITPFSALIPSLIAGKIDVIAAALLRTPEREKIVAFSDPVYSYSGALVVRRGETRRFSDLATARALRIGGQIGTRFIAQLHEAGVATVSTYEGLGDMLRDLDHGRVDAIYGDEPILRYQLRVGPRRDVEFAEGFAAPAREELCLVLRHGDPLVSRIDAAIAVLRPRVIPAIARHWGLEGRA